MTFLDLGMKSAGERQVCAMKKAGADVCDGIIVFKREVEAEVETETVVIAVASLGTKSTGARSPRNSTRLSHQLSWRGRSLRNYV